MGLCNLSNNLFIGGRNMKRISRRNPLCAMCTYWDGFRLLYMKHHSNDWFELDDRKEAACFHPDKFGQYKKKGDQLCAQFKSRF